MTDRNNGKKTLVVCNGLFRYWVTSTVISSTLFCHRGIIHVAWVADDTHDIST